MLRQAVEKDMEAILKIYNDAVLNSTVVYAYTAQTLEERKLWFKNKKKDRFPVIIFEEHNIVLGFATFGSFRAWPAYKYTIEHSIYVDSNYRNRGVGTALIKEIIRIANERHYATLVAGIDANNKKSIKLHEKFGFKYSGTIKRAGYKFGKWLDLAFYQLNLQGPIHPMDG